MATVELRDAPDTVPAPPKPEVPHPMRELTLKVAMGNEWTEETAERIADMFSGMAEGWTAGHDNPDRDHLLQDALNRGAVEPGRVLELGSGTGLGTRELAKRFDTVIALDRSEGMLANAPSQYGPKVLADGAALPFEGGSVDVIVLVNMILFPKEVDRVLAPAGSVVWVNTFGENTPIYLTAQELDQVMPGEWTVTHARAGTGTWAVAIRN